jgi:hypothetical protein
MTLPVLQTGEIWIFNNLTTNNPHEDDYLGPVLVIDFQGLDKNYDGDIIRRNYEVLDLLRGGYEQVVVDEQNAKYWRQLA